MTEFATRVDAFFTEYFALEPVDATGAGNHAHDGRWPDVSETGRTERLAFIDRWQATFAAFADDALDVDERLDRDLLLGVLGSYAFNERELREDAWSPMAWVYLIGQGFFALIAREFAPLADRLASIAARAEGIPAVLAAATEALVGVEGRPVDRFHTETALEQWPGLIGIVDEAIETGDAAAAAGDAAVAAVLPRLRAARDVAGAALAAFETRLRERSSRPPRARAASDRRCSRAKMTHTMQDARADPGADPGAGGARVRGGPRGDDPDRARDRAGVASATSRSPTTTARSSGRSSPRSRSTTRRPTSSSTSAAPSSAGSRTSAASATSSACPTSRSRSAGRRSSCGRSAGRCSARRGRSRRARRRSSRSPRSPPTGPRTGGVVASRGQRPDAPAPDDPRGGPRPLPPGRVRQPLPVDRPGPVRDGVFAEGWAVYVTQVMLDAGYGADDLALMLTHWKYYLRASSTR